MNRRRFTEEQIVGVLKEHRAGLSAAELCRKYEISDATYHNWPSIASAPVLATAHDEVDATSSG